MDLPQQPSLYNDKRIMTSPKVAVITFVTRLFQMLLQDKPPGKRVWKNTVLRIHIKRNLQVVARVWGI